MFFREEMGIENGVDSFFEAWVYYLASGVADVDGIVKFPATWLSFFWCS